MSDLRDYNKIPERLMSDRRWSEIKYTTVPAMCMQKNCKVFEKHDKERFAKYREQLKKGKAKAKVAGLTADAILDKAVHGRGSEAELGEAMWKQMVETLRKSAPDTVKRCVAVCDPCMDVSVALSLLLADVSQSTKLLSFSSPCETFAVDEDSLKDRYEQVRKCTCGTLNIEEVLNHTLSMDQMPSRIYIFSCMDFFHVNKDKSDFNKLEHIFKKRGLKMPEIV